MLNRLLVENLGVFAKSEVDFHKGLTVITGETGAGKTMMTKSVELISGMKPDSALIGPRKQEAYLEAEFTDQIPDNLKDLADEDEDLILSRKLSKNSKAKAFVSGRTCSASLLQEAASSLLSLTGQHSSQRLYNKDYQLRLLDRFAGVEKERKAVEDKYKEWQEKKKLLKELQMNAFNKDSRLEILKHEANLIAEINPSLGEDEELEKQREKALHIDTLIQKSTLISELFFGENEVLDKMALIQKEVDAMVSYDPNLEKLQADLESTIISLEDLSREMQRMAEEYDSPYQLEEIEERLLALQELKRRFHGLEIKDIKEKEEEIIKEIEVLSSNEKNLEEIEKDIIEKEKEYLEYSKDLSLKRKAASKKLISKVEANLKSLNLRDAKFTIEFNKKNPQKNGEDEIIFFLQPNPGLEPRPLGNGASGGEVSRVNLALLLSIEEDHSCYIFDEIDQGIGGYTATAVGDKLKELSKTRQVIVITHLAQVAVKADHHLLIEKETKDGLANTTLKELKDEDKDLEIARMMGVDNISQEEAKRQRELLK